ncbi:hypothetical protein ACXGQW_05085 [Wenyingzhuangia sp. IMCC45533]
MSTLKIMALLYSIPFSIFLLSAYSDEIDDYKNKKVFNIIIF